MLAQESTSDPLLLVLGIVFIVNAIALIVFVLFRQSDSGGIGAAFGGGDSGGAFGTKGQAVVDRVIGVMGALFVVLALVFSLLANSAADKSAEGAQGTTQQESSDDGGE